MDRKCDIDPVQEAPIQGVDNNALNGDNINVLNHQEDFSMVEVNVDLTRDEVVMIAKEAAQQVAQQAAQNAATQAASQIAQQQAQQVAEAVSQAVSKVMQSQTTTTGATTVARNVEDVGETERFATEQVDRSGIIFSNQKRTYDEYQQESLESIKRNRSYVDKILSDAHGYDMNARNIANQALQNAVETANMVGKQAVRHGDVAIDRQWNVDEQGYQVDAIISALKPTLETVVAKILADMAGSK